MRALALRKGFAAATVDEVCAAAGVTKGSFYHHFATKEALGLATLQSYFDEITAGLTSGAWTKQQDPRARLLAFLDHTAKVLSGPLLAHGCLLGIITLELAEDSPAFQRDVAAKFEALRGAVRSVFEPTASLLPSGISAADLADQLLATIEGAILLAKARQAPRASALPIQTFRRCVEQLIGADHHTRTGAP